MNPFSFIITMGCLILVIQVSSIIEPQAAVDSNLIGRDLDAYKENYSDPDLLKKKNEVYYKKLLSPDFVERDHAIFFFSHFIKEELDKKVIYEIIDLFKKEREQWEKFTDFVNKGGTAENLPKDIAYVNSEEYGMYHIYLCRLVGKSGDKNVLPLLIQNCLDPETYIYVGEDAVDPFLSIVQKPSVHFSLKRAAIDVLAEMLKPKKEGYDASGETRNKIKKVLIQAASDSDKSIRQASVRALGDSGDKDVIPILTVIAKSDPYHFEKKDKTTGKMTTRFPVREEAEKALKKLR